MGKWGKGISGNPRGRPPKKRALTDLLEKIGKKKSQDGQSNSQIFAEKIWDGLTTGVITYPPVTIQVEKVVKLPSGKESILLVDEVKTPKVILSAGDLIALARLVLTQIDGPPKQEHDVDLNNGSITFVVGEGLKSDD